MNDEIEYLDFEEETTINNNNTGLVSRKKKKSALTVATLSFLGVLMLFTFGYGTLFGFSNLPNLLRGNVTTDSNVEIKVTSISPIVKDLTLKENTARKVYLTVAPANATNKNIEYISTDDKVAKVSSDGKVTALKEGNATIIARTTDGSNKTTEFDVKVIKNATGVCEFSELEKESGGVSYKIDCNNATIKEVEYKIDGGNYQTLLSKKSYGTVEFSSDQLKEDITFKVVYNANNSSINKYTIKKLVTTTTTTKKVNGKCVLSIPEIKTNSLKYDISCTNSEVVSIAYKLGNDGSYVGIDTSNLADTIIFDEAGITRALYFKVEYKVDGTEEINTISKNNIVPNAIIETEEN